MDQIQPTEHADLRKNPGPRQHPGPGWITSTEAGEIFGISQGAVGQRLRCWARRYGDHGVRRVNGYIHEQDWRDFVARADATPRLPPSKNPERQQSQTPLYDAHAEVALLARYMMLDCEPRLRSLARRIADADTLDEQRRLIERLAKGESTAQQCAAETLTAIAQGEMPCRVSADAKHSHNAARALLSKPRHYYRTAQVKYHPAAEALRRCREKLGLTQTAASLRVGWEKRKWGSCEVRTGFSAEMLEQIEIICAREGIQIGEGNG